jgi:hypothetical protein
VALWRGRRFRQCGITFYSLRNNRVAHSCEGENEALVTEEGRFFD